MTKIDEKLVRFQTDRSEWFAAPILEILGEYETWRAASQPQGHPELVERVAAAIVRARYGQRSPEAEAELMKVVEPEARAALEATGIALKEVERERDELRERVAAMETQRDDMAAHILRMQESNR
jgi:hypothetical protein